MWTNRHHHAEAMINNIVGYLRIKPDPAIYRSANGLVDLNKRNQLVAFAVKEIQKKVDPARIVVSYPGDVWIGITPKKPLLVDERNVNPDADDWETSSQAVEFLDWLGEQTVTLYGPASSDDEEERSGGMPMPFSFLLEKWAPKDPESFSMGANIKEPTGGGFRMPT